MSIGSYSSSVCLLDKALYCNIRMCFQQMLEQYGPPLSCLLVGNSVRVDLSIEFASYAIASLRGHCAKVKEKDMQNEWNQVRFFRHPDVCVLHAKYDIEKGLNKKTSGIQIDEVRKFISFIQQTSISSGNKVGLVIGADSLTYSAANALLKIIEEPVGNSIIILTASSEKTILPTLLSRCKIFRVGALNEAEFQLALKSYDLDLSEEQVNRLYRYSTADPRCALNIECLGAMQLIEQIETMFVSPKWHVLQSIVNFAVQDDEYWEIIKSTIFYMLHKEVLNCISKPMLLNNAIIKFSEIKNLMYNAERNFLDKAATLACIFYE